MSSCVWMPEKKAKRELYVKLKRNFGQRTGAIITNKVTSTSFIDKYKDSLVLDEGIPTYESVMSLPVVKSYIGEKAMMEMLNKEQVHIDDTLDNTAYLVNSAEKFNREHDDFVAIVDYDSEGKITLSIEPKNKGTESIAENQLKIQRLNEKIAEILSPLGITMSTLSSVEVAKGRVGLTNFEHAKDMATNFAGLMSVANNMEGNHAISEEFSHFIIGVYRNAPLVKRSINFLMDEEQARAVLGDEYDQVSEYYQGDKTMIAEEAAGKLLRQAMLNNPPRMSLFRRMVDYIIRLFKGISPSYFTDSLVNVEKDLSSLANAVLNQKKTISKKDILKAQRQATFNALSEKAEAQVEALRKISERAFKEAALAEDFREEPNAFRGKTRKAAESLQTTLRTQIKQEETMAAIAAYLGHSNRVLKELYNGLLDIESLDMQDRFILLRNTLNAIQAHKLNIEDLRSVTLQEYLSDEGIRSQHFMLDDSTNSFEEFEVEQGVSQANTSSMTPAEIADLIVKNSEKWKLSDDESHYESSEGKALRTTQVITADVEGEAFDPNSPWKTPSSNIGTGIDELVRDIMSGRIVFKDGYYQVEGKPLYQVYPNISRDSANSFAESVLRFKEAEEAKGITFIPRDVVVNGTIDTLDGAGNVHKVSVAGTLDLLGYDKDGNWYVYDMKTHRSDIKPETKAKYERQLSLYKKFLEDAYGIKVKGLKVIPIKVSYPTPRGAGKGSAEYTVSGTKNPLYPGKKSNQLKVDGKLFKGANPQLDPVMEIGVRDLNIDYAKLSGDLTGGFGQGAQAILDALDSVSRNFDELNNLFTQNMLPQFLEFLKPFVGENIAIREYDKNGKFTGKMKTVSIAKVLTESSKDVSLAQRWLTSMADNPDAFLQIFDKVVNLTKGQKRLKVIEKAKEIIALGKEYEAKGITSYDFMYEDDKKNYVSHIVANGHDYSYSRYDYEQAKAAEMSRLDAIYGEHPEVGSQEYKDKKDAERKWINDNSITLRDDNSYVTIPSPSKYPSRYNSFTDVQKEFYDKWMRIKGELDALIGGNKTYLTNTIKIRKSGIERLKSSLSGNAITEFVENVKSKVIRSFDDDISYEASGIKGFNDEEVMKLPLYYINAKGDTNDLSTDAIGTLVAYAEMALNYDAMRSIVDPMEIGRFIAKSRAINTTRGDKRVYESFGFGEYQVKNPLYTDPAKSNFMKVLDDFFESKIYQRYLVDNGEVMGIDKNKAAGLLLKLGSTVQLGFNIMAGFANIATGIAMQNIETAAGEYFNARELASADKTFAAEMPAFMAEIGQRVKTSKLALFDELFDVRQNMSKMSKNYSFLNKSILTRIFGPNIQYICQDAGDHWLYNRAAIAIVKRYKVLDGDRQISLWDALEKVPVDPSHPEYGMKLKVKEGIKKLDGSDFTDRDILDVSDRIKHINQHCFGIYNDEDAIAARRTIVGRMIMQYRDWIPAQFRYRFGAMTTNLNKGEEEIFEGYYRTSGRVLMRIFDELKNGEMTIGQVWDDLEDFEKANIRRTIAELSQYCALLVFSAILHGLGDDKKERMGAIMAKTYSYASYITTREKTELGALIPVSMPKELIKILNAPFANTSVMSDIYNLRLCLWPMNWTDEIQNGDYKSHSTAYRAFMRSPMTVWYRTLKRSLDPEKAEKYFDR